MWASRLRREMVSGGFERSGAGLRNVEVLIFGSVAGADRADADAVDRQRHSAAYRSLLSVAGDREAQRDAQVHLVASTRGAARLAAERRGERLANGDLDRRKLRAVHARESQQVAAVVHDGDIHGHADFRGALFGGGQHGLARPRASAFGVLRVTSVMMFSPLRRVPLPTSLLLD